MDVSGAERSGEVVSALLQLLLLEALSQLFLAALEHRKGLLFIFNRIAHHGVQLHFATLFRRIHFNLGSIQTQLQSFERPIEPPSANYVHLVPILNEGFKSCLLKDDRFSEEMKMARLAQLVLLRSHHSQVIPQHTDDGLCSLLLQVLVYCANRC